MREDERHRPLDEEPPTEAWPEADSGPAEDEEAGDLGSEAATSPSTAGLIEVGSFTLRDVDLTGMGGHLETEAEQGADGRTSANGSYRSPDAQAAVPFDRNQSSALQQGDQSEQVVWFGWTPIEIHDNQDGTGYRYRPNREAPFFIQDPDDPLRYLFERELDAMVAAEGKWIANGNPDMRLEELRAAALQREGAYTRILRRFPHLEYEYTDVFDEGTRWMTDGEVWLCHQCNLAIGPEWWTCPSCERRWLDTQD